MQRFPHHYSASAVGSPTGSITVSSPELPALSTDSPPEFDGPAGLWSPETLLPASVANCLALTWRSIAAHNGFDWLELTVDAAAILDRVERVTRFTEIHLTARLIVRRGADGEAAVRLMHKAEAGCLISNSLSATVTLDVQLTER